MGQPRDGDAVVVVRAERDDVHDVHVAGGARRDQHGDVRLIDAVRAPSEMGAGEIWRLIFRVVVVVRVVERAGEPQTCGVGRRSIGAADACHLHVAADDVRQEADAVGRRRRGHLRWGPGGVPVSPGAFEVAGSERGRDVGRHDSRVSECHREGGGAGGIGVVSRHPCARVRRPFALALAKDSILSAHVSVVDFHRRPISEEHQQTEKHVHS